MDTEASVFIVSNVALTTDTGMLQKSSTMFSELANFASICITQAAGHRTRTFEFVMQHSTLRRAKLIPPIFPLHGRYYPSHS